MFKKILVPLDGSENSELIGGWVTGLAQAIGAEMMLLAVIDPPDVELPRSTPVAEATHRGEAPYDAPGRESAPMGAVAVTGARQAMGHGEPPVHAPAFGTQIIDRAVENAKVYLAHEADRVNASGVKVTLASTANVAE